MKPDQPSARSDPASSSRPSGRCIAAWWCSYQPGRWIAQVPREYSSATQSWVVAATSSIARQDRLEVALHAGQVRRVARSGVATEADQQLRPVVRELLGRQVAERMTRPDRGL